MTGKSSDIQFSANGVLRLVPKPEPERRAIVRQLLDIRFYVATEIAEIHTVDFGGKSITGHPGIGSSFLDANDDELNLYIARDLSNPLEVVARLASYYEINEAVRLNLLYTLFSVEDTGILETIFAKEGFVISRVDAEAVRRKSDSVLATSALSPLTKVQTIEQSMRQVHQQLKRERRIVAVVRISQGMWISYRLLFKVNSKAISSSPRLSRTRGSGHHQHDPTKRLKQTWKTVNIRKIASRRDPLPAKRTGACLTAE